MASCKRRRRREKAAVATVISFTIWLSSQSGSTDVVTNYSQLCIRLLRAKLKLYEVRYYLRKPMARSIDPVPFFSFFFSKQAILSRRCPLFSIPSPLPLRWLSGAALSYSTMEYSTASYYGFLVTAAFYFARALRSTVARRQFIYINSE